MDNKNIEVHLSSRDRLYVKVYHDFLECPLLTGKEKMIFIALKRYADFKNDKNGIDGNVYPTIDSICKITGESRPTVTKIIKSLQRKGVVKIERRGLTKSNLYKIVDNEDMWKSGTISELKIATEETELERSIRIVKNAGYTVVKERGLETTAPSKVTADSSTQNNNNMYTKKNTTMGIVCQDRYSLEQIQQLYDYDILLQDNPGGKENIDAVMAVLQDALNTGKDTIRIAGENRPAMSVIGKLMRLTYLDIAYALEKFSSQTERIKNPTAYLLTILYSAKEQSQLEAKNRVAHDLAHGKVDEK